MKVILLTYDVLIMVEVLVVTVAVRSTTVVVAPVILRERLEPC